MSSNELASPYQSLIAPASIRVCRAALALDAVQPGWAGRLDLGLLDLDSADSCILGQLFEPAKPVAWRRMWAWAMDFDLPARGWTAGLIRLHVFDPYLDLSVFTSREKYQDLWMGQIANRLHPVTERDTQTGITAALAREEVGACD